ncbi:hypothetical protein GC093_33620 [Paenibacillus sp. LMG 31456]|uniref:Uncharacterized protein n=1 Tax=Paenibacillus foliorum TaxID=2654974 RepID=A0A972H1J1_9BACL|nr:hypothetical protein [Paenibacillus foliorum]NOU98133.1 hypothetical protein [Paenibacillus foliorum]
MLHDMLGWIRDQKMPSSFESTGLTKTIYLDIMEQTLRAYNKEALERRLPPSKADKVDDIHAYARITSIIGILISQGRLRGWRSLWERMMDACCNDFHRASHDYMIDFSVKEIMLSYLAMKEQLDEPTRERWLTELRKIEPERNYFHLIREGRDESHLHNINVYNMVGEYLRETEGLTDTNDYFARHWPAQLERFDGNGMYKDPNCPILYDLATRVQIQLVLGHGYKGEFLEALDSQLKKGALCTLFMQSAAFEHPYGGRSNQYLFNEALMAANAEYEACRYRDSGDLKTAGAFKRSARLAVQSVLRWLEKEPPRHIKNMYAIESQVGTESYGYYDKYMATLGSFIYIAYLFADDQIEEQPCPAEIGGYVWETSEAFHKIFANAANYSLQIDTKADHHYDSTGLGRLHRRGVPSELGLSTPFTATPSYVLPAGTKPTSLAIGPGWKDDNGNLEFLSDLSDGLEHRVKVLAESSDRVIFELEYFGDAFTSSCASIKECYTLNKDGLVIHSELNDRLNSQDIVFRVPLLCSNGEAGTEQVKHNGKLIVSMKSNDYIIDFEEGCKILECHTANRNGQYSVLQVEGQSKAKVQVHLQLR